MVALREFLALPRVGKMYCLTSILFSVLLVFNATGEYWWVGWGIDLPLALSYLGHTRQCCSHVRRLDIEVALRAAQLHLLCTCWASLLFLRPLIFRKCGDSDPSIYRNGL